MNGRRRIPSFAKTHATARAGQTLYHAKTPTKGIYIICDGVAVRHKILPDGRRQILSPEFPGELVWAGAVFRDRLNFSIQALTDTRLCILDRKLVAQQIAANADIAMRLLELSVLQSEYLDCRILQLGRLNAEERIAHVIVEFIERIEPEREHTYRFPLRQKHIADFTGLTPTHVSRVITTYRNQNIFEFKKGILTVFDMTRLRHLAGMPA